MVSIFSFWANAVAASASKMRDVLSLGLLL